MLALYHTIVYQPLYNGLIFLLSISPVIDTGIAVIILTIVVKIVLFPLSKKFIATQMVMKEVQPLIDSIKAKYKDRQEQARKIMDVYKDKKVNPFSGFLLILVQIPILFALYSVFNSGLPAIKLEDLYSFISAPSEVSMMFLGWFDVSEHKNIILALLVALTQFFQARFMIAGQKPAAGGAPSAATDFARSMNVQMQYVLPIFIGVISYNLSGALAIYWITSNLFAIGQEIYMKRLRKLRAQ